MKAIVQNRYGGVDTLSIIERNKPSIRDTQILIKVRYANISAGDMHMNLIDVGFPLNIVMKMIFGFKKPKAEIRGTSGSGIVEAVGKDVQMFQVGDHVNFINSLKAGVLAECLVMNESGRVTKVDKSVPLEDAAPIAFGALSANHFINLKTIKSGMNVMIYGASGSVGSYASSLASHYGAHVTMVASNKHHEKLKSLKGRLITYENDTYLNVDETYDVIFDAVRKINKKMIKHLLKKGGTFYSIKSPTKESLTRLNHLNSLLKENQLQTIIDHIYPFEAFKEAHQKVYDGHKTGNILIQID